MSCCVPVIPKQIKRPWDKIKPKKINQTRVPESDPRMRHVDRVDGPFLCILSHSCIPCRYSISTLMHSSAYIPFFSSPRSSLVGICCVKTPFPMRIHKGPLSQTQPIKT
jgi:hypothetical protein